MSKMKFKQVEGVVLDEQMVSFLEFDNFSIFPTIGRVKVIYFDKSTEKLYRWSTETNEYVIFQEELNVEEIIREIQSDIEEIVGRLIDDRYVLKSEIDQLIRQGIEDYFNENPDNPDEPDEPVEPDEPTGDIGIITDDNSIVVDETQLENGTYTLRYIDANGNVIGNFNEITSFEINR